jgi:DnaJ-class molecular chaperone
MIDPYQTLGVPKTATAEQIKNAYRGLAKKFHPDLNPGNKQAEHKFKDINAANEILSSPENKAKFDRGEWGEPQAPPGGGQRHHGGPYYRDTGGGARYAGGGGAGFDESIFENLFRGGGRRGSGGFQVAGEDETYRLEVEPRDTVLGAEREIQFPGGKRLSVKIPKGVVEGQKLRFAGQAAPGFGGGPSGDVYVEIILKPDERFRTEGANLLHDLNVPLDVAVLGGEITVPTPESQVSLSIPAHSSSGKRLRVPGRGLFAKGGKRGDLVVTLRVQLPDPFDPELEAAIRAWREKKEGNGL